jgi:hypothetical protein
MVDYVQGWRTKWFYIKDKQASEVQNFGLAPFGPKKEVKKLKSCDQVLSVGELEETKPLMTRIKALQAE